MKKIVSILIIVTFFNVPVLLAKDKGSHSIYRITAYNFGNLGDKKDATTNLTASSFPLLITGYHSDVLDNMNIEDEALIASTKRANAGGFAVSAQYSPNNKFAFSGAIGFTDSKWSDKTENNRSSWEANLGIIYKLFNNVSYGVHFGYMDTGGTSYNKQSSTYSDVESIIMISNQLTLSF